jgi:hypothetical protein
MDFTKRLFPAAFTATIGMLALNFLLSEGGSLASLISRPVLMQGAVIFVAQIISDYLSPSVRAEFDTIF